MVIIVEMVHNGFAATFAERSLVRHQVGHAPEHVEADFALIDDIALIEQNISHLEKYS